MKHIGRVITLIWLCLFVFEAHAQMDVNKNIACPRGQGVVFDTIFYSPVTPMPFDRCFDLKLQFKEAPKIKYFAINPIDRYGRLAVTRRDYNVFVKSGWPRGKARKNIREKYPFSKFKNSPLVRLFDGVKAYPNGKVTDVYLNMPQLEPNREYQILLLDDDLQSIEKVIKGGVLAFNTGRSTRPPGTVMTIDQMMQRMNAENSRQKGRLGPQVTGNGLFDFLASDTLRINKEYLHAATFDAELKARKEKAGKKFDSVYSVETKYRVYFQKVAAFTPRPTAPTLPGISPLDDKHYDEAISKGDPINIRLLDKKFDPVGNVIWQLLDVNNVPVDLYQDGLYEVYVRTQDQIRKLDLFDHTYPESYEDEVAFYRVADISIKNGGKDLKSEINSALLDKDQIKYLPNTRRLYQEIADKTTAVDIASSPAAFDTKALAVILNELQKCPCSDKEIRDQAQLKEMSEIIAALSAASADVTVLDKLRRGLISSKDLITEAKDNDLKGRAANLDYTTGLLKKLIPFVALYNAGELTNRNHTKELYTALKTYQASLTDETDVIASLGALNAKLTNNVKAKFGFMTAKPISANSSESLDFVSANKFKIIPDFGLIGVFKGNHSLQVQDLVPYLGFNYNFRSIDKDITMRRVRFKPLSYYLSFHMGVTLASLKIDNKRDNLLGGSCIITGFGYRLNHTFRLTGGGVWFRSVNKNPLITDKPLGFSPYVGLSVDLDLYDRFGGVKKLFL